MPSGTPPSRVEWVPLSCPSCNVKMRIKAVYAHLRGRCPECGARIEAPRPTAGHTTTVADDGLPALLPVEEEWPESARLEEEGRGYGWGAAAAAPPVAPPPAPVSAESYSLASAELPVAAPAPAAEAAAAPYAVKPPAPPPPSAYPDVGHGSYAGLVREPPPPPPARPLWDGVYTFPWRPDNLAVWLVLTLTFGLLAILATAAVALAEAGSVLLIGVILLIPLILIIGIWTGMYASGCFFAVIEETVAGNDQVSWPSGGGIGEGLGKVAYLLWLGGCSGIVAVLLWLAASGAAPEDDLWWLVSLLTWALLFPVVLFSSMAASSRWLLLEKDTLLGFLMKPRLVLLMLVASLVLLIPVAWVGYRALAGVNFLAAAACGPLGATVFLIYGRLLGRVGWVLTQAPSRTKGSAKKRRKTRAVNTPDQ